MDDDQSMKARLAAVGRRVRDLEEQMDAELEVRYRLVVEARDQMHMTTAAIAKALGIGRSGVYHILGRPR